MSYKTFNEVLENLNEGSTFTEKVLMYWALQEGVILRSHILREKIENLMFDAILGKQELGELPGILNPNTPEDDK